MRFLVSWSLIMGLCFFSACHSEEDAATPDATLSDPCGETKPVVKMAASKAGVVRYNTGEKQYAIVTPGVNATASQDIGIVCNLPDKLKIDGLAVSFSGEYKEYDKTPATKVNGQTFYYLLITRLTSSKGNVQ